MAELSAEIRATSARIEDVNRRQRAFASKNMAMLAGTGYVFIAHEITSRADFDATLLGFNRERHALSNRMNNLLKEHAQIKLGHNLRP